MRLTFVLIVPFLTASLWPALLFARRVAVLPGDAYWKDYGQLSQGADRTDRSKVRDWYKNCSGPRRPLVPAEPYHKKSREGVGVLIIQFLEAANRPRK